MRLFVEDESMSVDVGTGSIWYSIFSTAMIRLPEETRLRVPLGILFLKNAECSADDAKETAKQMNLIRDAFAGLSPEEAVFDMHNINKPAPWHGKISPVVTSCANLYTTSDGKDLFSEVIRLLCYAGRKDLKIFAS